jgi:signal transduction histidine kinase
LLVAAGSLLVGLSLTAIAANAAFDTESRQRLRDLERSADLSAESIQHQIDFAVAEIKGLEAMFAVGSVSRLDFSRYVETAGNPGRTQALSFGRRLASSEREAFEANVRADDSLVDGGYPDFAIVPVTGHNDIFVVDYIEPLEGNEAAFGFDLGSNDSRREAIEHARDSGETVATEGIQLVQDEQARFGLLLMRPVYVGGTLPSTVDRRRSLFRGIVTGVFIVDELLADSASVGTTIDIVVKDSGHLGTSDLPEQVLYASGPTEVSPELLSVVRHVSVGDRAWSLTVIELAGPRISLASLANVIGAAGFLLSLAFAVTAWTILRSRDRAASAAHEATVELRQRAEELLTARDEALAADRLKTTFLANMSHELRTPLNAVIGLSSVLTNQVFGPLTAKQGQYLDRISTAGDHLLNLIDDLLALARIEAGKDELNLEYLDLGQEVTATLGLIRDQADDRGIVLKSDLPSEPVVVQADRRRLRQILLNLISNAIKFTPDGRNIGVDVTSRGGEAEIVVWDTGIGISQHDLDRVFEPFFQADSGLSRSRDGSGLGLTLTKRLVELQNAVLHVESSSSGSRFVVGWPTVDQAATNQSQQLGSPLPPSQLSGMRVLLAEDNEDNRVLVQDLLQFAGCHVIGATDGQAAINVALTEEPDLIVLDMQMPRLDGFSVARDLRSEPTTRRTPILAVTAMAMPHEIERIMSAGCDGCLSKPFTQDQFFAAIRSVIRDPVVI